MSVLDLFRLDGKVALITGAGQGIGRKFALAMAEAGADVAIAEINEKTGRRVADEVASLGRRSLYIRVDVAKHDEVEAMVATTASELGGRDILVDGGHTLNVWLKPIEREMAPLVSPEDEIDSLIHDLDMLGIPHDERGVTHQ